MKKSIFNITLLLLLATMLFVGTLPATAAAIQEPGISPLWDNISTITLNLTFDDDRVGTATGTARKKSTAASISGTLTVYELVGDDWIYVDSDSNSRTVGTLLVSISFQGAPGTTYKAVWDVTAYAANGTPEPESFEKIETCP